MIISNNMNTDYQECPMCGSPVKERGSSMHVWEITYECGCIVWGALDTETHGDGVEYQRECPNVKKVNKNG